MTNDHEPIKDSRLCVYQILKYVKAKRAFKHQSVCTLQADWLSATSAAGRKSIRA